MVRSKTVLELDAAGDAEEVEDEGAVEDVGDAARGAELGHVELAAEEVVE